MFSYRDGKWAAGLLFWALLTQNKVLAQDVFRCPLCGEDKELKNPDGVVTIPQNGDFLCSTLIQFSEQGGIDAATCAFLQPLIETPCGCRDPVAVNGTAAPTESPTMSPTFGAPPDCFTDLNNIFQRESALTQQETQIGRTYVLCPDTVYFMGRLNPSGEFVDGFDAITPRPNVHYKCGDSGSSSNNCRLLDGTYAIISFGGDPEHSNVTFQGLTIESSTNGGVIAARPGDLNFIDCIFKNHENQGPVHILFDSPAVRRLTRSGWVQNQAGLPELVKSYTEGGVNDIHDGPAQEEQNSILQEDDRQLQALTTLTLSFRQCIFEGNKLVGSFANTGMINSVTPETILIFEDVIFRNNDYGDNTLKSSTSAIHSRGPLTVRNSCFIDNAFIRDAPAVNFGDTDLDTSNNYVSTADDQLFCSLVVTYANQTAWVNGTDLTCTVPEAESCQAVMAPAPQPTPGGGQPTRFPVPRATLAPVVPPTSSPSKAPVSAGSAPSFLCAAYVTVFAGLSLIFIL